MDLPLVGVPGSLHSYLLAVTRSADGTDGIGAVHRVVLSCPGEGWCHRGGCPDPGFPLAAPLLTQIVTAADTAGVAAGRGGWATGPTSGYMALWVNPSAATASWNR